VGLDSDPRTALIAILRLAYSGELAAAFAYRGHARSVSSPEEREAIRKIEGDEWHHRTLVGEMLKDLGAAPLRVREVRAWCIGRTLGLLCHVTGWLLPMYGAGKLERRNIVEYETAARHASASGREDLVDCLLTMAEVEWDHEAYFRARVVSHRLAPRIPIWPAPPPRAAIRTSYTDQRHAALAS
jgi:demethoxyubiquinone hydroxylase (CLK1/Coq7/Cat5 family)